MISYIENASHTVDGIYIAGRAMNWADGEFHRWGEMQQSVWDNYTEFMVEYGVIDAPIDSAELFTNEFLPEK